MQFLTMRELCKAPKAALSRLTQDGKAVLTNNGKPTALMLNIDEGNFEQVFGIVQEVERRMVAVNVSDLRENDDERSKAFERLMNFPRAKLPADFDHKKELAEAIDERFNRAD
jgi:hypothetical protein